MANMNILKRNVSINSWNQFGMFLSVDHNVIDGFLKEQHLTYILLIRTVI